MTILFGIIILVCLISYGFSPGTARGIVRLVLILACIGSLAMAVAVLVEVSKPVGPPLDRNVVHQRWGVFQ